MKIVAQNNPIGYTIDSSIKQEEKMFSIAIQYKDLENRHNSMIVAEAEDEKTANELVEIITDLKASCYLKSGERAIKLTVSKNGAFPREYYFN